MKAITWLCGLSVASAALAAELKPAAPADGQAAQAVVVTVEADENGEVTKNVKVVKIGEGEGDCENAKVMVLHGNGESYPGVKVLTNLATVGDPNRGWLGVALGETVEQEGDKAATSGIVVLNVVKESPAEAAGLLKDDVITAINGTPVTGSVADLSKLIGEIGPGGVARISVLRADKPLELTATLTAPKAGSIQWQHTPDVKFTQKIRMAPHVGMLTPQGNMQFFNIELDGTEGLPDAIAEMVNRGTSVKMSVEDGQRTIELNNNDNGNVTEIRQEADGPITVKRYTEGSDDVTEQEYADAAALAAGDPEAAELYNAQADRSANVWMDKEGDVFTFNFDTEAEFDPSELHEQLLQKFQGSGLNEEALEATHEALANAFRSGQGGAWIAMHNKATRTFKVNPEGQIEVTVRKGDSEIVKTYKNEADLQARDAEAFEKYQEVTNAEVEE